MSQIPMKLYLTNQYQIASAEAPISFIKFGLDLKCKLFVCSIFFITMRDDQFLKRCFIGNADIP